MVMAHGSLSAKSFFKVRIQQNAMMPLFCVGLAAGVIFCMAGKSLTSDYAGGDYRYHVSAVHV